MQLTLAAILLGAARTALAQECLVYASSTNPAAAASTDVAPSCGFRGWDTGTNIGYFADAKYASYSACKNLCGAYGGCLSFTYKTADPAVCILYDHIVEGVNTKDAGSPFVFFNDGGLCPGAAVASSAPAVASSSTAKPSTLVTSTTPAAAAKATTTSAAQLTTLYTTSTVYTTSLSTSVYCDSGLVVCLHYATVTNTVTKPVATTVVPYTTKAV